MSDKPWEIKAPHASVGLPNTEAARQLSEELVRIPGIRQRGPGWIVPRNAIEVFAELCEKYRVTPAYMKWIVPPEPRASWPAVEQYMRFAGEVRSDVVLDGFLMPYQRDAIEFGWNKSGVHIWHQTGAGKTITGLLCCLSVGGPIVIITRAASRLQFGREIERFTRLKPFILSPQSADKGILKVGGQTWIEFFKEHMPVLRKAGLVAEAWAAAKEQRPVVVEKRSTLEAYLNECKYEKRRPVVIVGWESLPTNLDRLKALRPGVVLYDECFPAETPILTRRGWSPIAKVEPGTDVLSFNTEKTCFEWKKVLRKIEVPAEGRQLLRVVHSCGQLTATSNHEFWTEEEGYVKAGQLTSQHQLRVLRVPCNEEATSWEENTTILRSRVQWPLCCDAPLETRGEALPVVQNGSVLGTSEFDEEILRNLLLRQVENESGRRQRGLLSWGESGAGRSCLQSPPVSDEGSRSISRKNAASKPNEGPDYAGKGFYESEAYGPQAQSTGRKWERMYATGGEPVTHDRTDPVLNRDSGCSKTTVQSKATQTLQDRSGRSSKDAGRGNRWFIAPGPDSERAGQKEGTGFVRSRVDRVEVLEQAGRTREGGNSCEDQWLYDLEVEGNHNYFASGVLVSNCHKGKNSSRWTVVPLVEPEGSTDREKVEHRLAQETEAKSLGGFIKDTEEGPRMFLPVMNMAAAAAQLGRVAKKRVATTATPVKDRVRDLWSQLDMIEPNAFGSKVIFETRHCDRKPGTYGGFDTRGSSNLVELKTRLSSIAHILKYEETHKSLPPKRRQSLYISPEDQCEPASGFARARAEARKRGAAASLELSLMEAATRKRTAVASIVEDHLTSGQKVVLFSGRRKDCEDLGKTIQNLSTVKQNGVDVWVAHGEQSQEMRDEIVQMYMAHPGPCAIVATWQAMGESLNLQDTDAAFFVMLPPTPGALRQGEGRFARHGQKRPVIIYYVIAEGTVDEHMAAILIDKLPAVERVVEDTELASAAVPLAGIDESESDEEFAQSILDSLDFG